MEKQYNVKFTQSTLDILTGLMDIALKSKGLDILGSITMLTNHIQQNISEITNDSVDQ